MFGLILALAILVERLVEFFAGKPLDHFDALRRYKWTQIYLALVLGIILAVGYSLDLIAELARRYVATISPDPSLLGMIFTGAIIGGGASFVHQMASAWFPPKRQGPPDEPLFGGFEGMG